MTPVRRERLVRLVRREIPARRDPPVRPVRKATPVRRGPLALMVRKALRDSKAIPARRDLPPAGPQGLQGLPGIPGPIGPQGPQPQGDPGPSWPSGSLLYLVQGATPPPGFTLLGTIVQRLGGSAPNLTINVYRKD